MFKVTYIEPGGEQRQVELNEGDSLMDGAIENLVKGIDGDCGGMCACATCHVHIGPEWQAKLPPISGDEDDLLGIAEARDEQSRLGCQIKMAAELDGIVVRVADHQH